MKQILALLCSFFFIQGAYAMSIFKPGKTCVFSPVKIHLTKDGQPVSDATVTRQWEWNDRREDVANTDENGVVEFDAVYESSVSRLLPTELVVGQQLSVDINGEEIILLTNSKREPEENAEFGGNKFHVRCELNEEERLVEDYGSLMVTKCHLLEN